MQQLFHIYIGKVYQGPARGDNPQHACHQFADKKGVSPYILHAVQAVSVQELKAPRHDSPAQA